MKLPLLFTPIEAGFPSPADDHLDQNLDLNEHLIYRPASTFFIRVSGDSMEGGGISHGDLLIVDRSLTPQHNDRVIAIIDGELTVKFLYKNKGIVKLVPANPYYPPIFISEDTDFLIWGVVTHAITTFKR